LEQHSEEEIRGRYQEAADAEYIALRLLRFTKISAAARVPLEIKLWFQAT